MRRLLCPCWECGGEEEGKEKQAQEVTPEGTIHKLYRLSVVRTLLE